MEFQSRFLNAYENPKEKVEGISEEPDLPKSRFEYRRKGKVEGMRPPHYDQNFFGNIFTKDYYCKTSGSDGGKLAKRVRHPDYDHVILILKEQGGFTVNGGPLRRFDDPLNHDFMDAIHYNEFPKELDPKVDDAKIHKFTITRDQDYKDPLKEVPPTKLFPLGTTKEVLDAAVADTPNSILIPLGTKTGEIRYMLYTFPPNQDDRNIQY